MPPAQKHPFSVGLTGGIGSGKSTVAALFSARGATIIDTDQIAHQLTAPDGLAIEAIRQTFGTNFITANGALDRLRMRNAIFTHPGCKKQLESILHPLIRQKAEQAAHASSGAYLMFVSPLLIESAFWMQRVTRILVVDCPEEMQVQRVMARSGMTEEQIRTIMATQATRAQRLAAATDILPNQGDKKLLLPLVDALHQRYLVMATP